MRRFLVPFAGLAAGLVVVLVVTLAGNQPVRVGAPSTDQQSGLAAAQTTQSSSGGPNEGIRVHGNWTIEVRNADGTLASRTDFENALVGGPVLSMVLARLTSVGYWSILLEAPANASTGPCGTTPLPPPYNLNPCYLVEAGSTGAVPGTTLTVTAPTSGADAGKLVLSGTGTASANSSIASVST